MRGTADAVVIKKSKMFHLSPQNFSNESSHLRPISIMKAKRMIMSITENTRFAKGYWSFGISDCKTSRTVFSRMIMLIKRMYLRGSESRKVSVTHTHTKKKKKKKKKKKGKGQMKKGC